MFTETGMRQGAAAVRRVAEKNPMQLLRSMRQADRTAGKDHMFAQWFDAVRQDDEYLIPTLLHAFTNMWEALEKDEARLPQGRPTKRQVAARKAHITKAVKTTVAQIILLNLEMPNGKRMRYCTGPEMEKFGRHFHKIAMRVGDKRVGEVLSEQEVRKLMSKV